MIHIYYLFEGEALVYIGRSENPEKRRKEHQRRFGLELRLGLTQRHSAQASAMLAETVAIREHQPRLNKTQCSRGSHKHPEEVRQRISQAKLGHLTSRETKDKIRRSVTGFKHSAVAREKISQALRGRRLSEASRERIAAAHRGSSRSEETKAAMRLAWERRRG